MEDSSSKQKKFSNEKSNMSNDYIYLNNMNENNKNIFNSKEIVFSNNKKYSNLTSSNKLISKEDLSMIDSNKNINNDKLTNKFNISKNIKSEDLSFMKGNNYSIKDKNDDIKEIKSHNSEINLSRENVAQIRDSLNKENYIPKEMHTFKEDSSLTSSIKRQDYSKNMKFNNIPNIIYRYNDIYKYNNNSSFQNNNMNTSENGSYLNKNNQGKINFIFRDNQNNFEDLKNKLESQEKVIQEYENWLVLLLNILSQTTRFQNKLKNVELVKFIL